jgi:stage II sporulation protein D
VNAAQFGDHGRARLTRRELLAAMAAAQGLLLAGCGEGRAGPGLLMTTVPTIRVRLGRPRKQAELRLGAGAWEITADDGRGFVLREAAAMRATLSAGAGGVVLAGRDTGSQRLRVRPIGAFLLDDVTYAGALIVRRDGANLVLDLETYTAGVIANESAPGAQPATHRAQAVTSRTYAYVRCTAPGADDDVFHVQDTESSQVYKGFTIRPEMNLAAADMLARAAETKGVVLTWQSRAFPTYFASTCGGHTTEASTSELDPGHAAEPLRGVPCAYCSTSPKYRWTKTVSDADLLAGMKRKGFPAGEPLTGIAVTQQGRGGWAKEVTVTYGPNGSTRPLPGTQFRSAAGLNSHRILALRRVEGGFEIDGAGWGHGVGMCQWGAFEMGKRGFSETDILRAYYPGITFTRMY